MAYFTGFALSRAAHLVLCKQPSEVLRQPLYWIFHVLMKSWSFLEMGRCIEKVTSL